MVPKFSQRLTKLAAGAVLVSTLTLTVGAGVANAAPTSGKTTVSECQQIARNYALDVHGYNTSNNYVATKGFQTMMQVDRADFAAAGCKGNIAVTRPD